MAYNTIGGLISTLEKERQAATDWFVSHEVILDPKKFQAIIVKRNISLNINYIYL